MTLAVLCPGQGDQHAAMLDLVATEAATALQASGVVAGIEWAAVIRDDSMFTNAIAQPLICASQCITWSLLAPRLTPSASEAALFAGYSVGELAAHGCAGNLPLDAVLSLAVRRAAVMDAASAPDDGLVALRGLARRTVDGLCAAHRLHVAIVNGDDHCIVGGAGAALAAFQADVEARGGRVQRLPVRIAAHTSLLAAAAGVFREDLSGMPWRFAAPVLAGIDGSVVRDTAEAVAMLSRQLAEPLDWAACMDSLVERGTTVCIELGPGSALARMTNERHPRVAARSVADFRSFDAVAEWVNATLSSGG